MTLDEIPDFPSTPTPLGNGRIYQVTKTVSLIAYPVEAPLPHAPDGSLFYAFFNRRQTGEIEWARDTDDLRKVMETWRRTTSPDYEPPDHRAPGGEHPHIRPPIQNLLKKAMEAARPDALDRARRDQPVVIEFDPSADDP